MVFEDAGKMVFIYRHFDNSGDVPFSPDLSSHGQEKEQIQSWGGAPNKLFADLWNWNAIKLQGQRAAGLERISRLQHYNTGSTKKAYMVGRQVLSQPGGPKLAGGCAYTGTYMYP